MQQRRMSLLAERKGHDQTKKSLSEAQETNKELLKKIEKAEKNIDQLLENVERSVFVLLTLFGSLA